MSEKRKHYSFHIQLKLKKLQYHNYLEIYILLYLLLSSKHRVNRKFSRMGTEDCCLYCYYKCVKGNVADFNKLF